MNITQHRGRRQGNGFLPADDGSWQTVYVKIDALDNTHMYKGSAVNPGNDAGPQRQQG
ncbi:hypothetical protein [Nocardioides sp.]|uniref:hypothetical protein n=1 Tax=Nocardioides sp. TaxID=35761 RepID=UPI0039E49343